LRKRAVLFAELADDAIAYIESRYARPADDVARMKMIKGWFPGRGAEDIRPFEIKNKLKEASAQETWSASTANHYHNLISLVYRLAIENEKQKESPIHRKVRKQQEDNSRVRFLTPDEEKKLRETLQSKPEWEEHEPELTLALHTSLRRRNMYRDLVWENVDLQARVAMIPRTSNRKRITKNGDPIVVPLNDMALRALAIFRSRGDGTGWPRGAQFRGRDSERECPLVCACGASCRNQGFSLARL
jgi:integrase